MESVYEAIGAAAAPLGTAVPATVPAMVPAMAGMTAPTDAAVPKSMSGRDVYCMFDDNFFQSLTAHVDKQSYIIHTAAFAALDAEVGLRDPPELRPDDRNAVMRILERLCGTADSFGGEGTGRFVWAENDQITEVHGMMYRCVMLSGDHIEVRAHAFEKGSETYIHSHQRNFFTYCVSGSYEHTLWETRGEGTHFSRVRETSGKYGLPEQRHGQLVPVNTHSFCCNQLMFVPTSAYHTVTVPFQGPFDGAADPELLDEFVIGKPLITLTIRETRSTAPSFVLTACRDIEKGATAQVERASPDHTVQVLDRFARYLGALAVRRNTMEGTWLPVHERSPLTDAARWPWTLAEYAALDSGVPPQEILVRRAACGLTET